MNTIKNIPMDNTKKQNSVMWAFVVVITIMMGLIIAVFVVSGDKNTANPTQPTPTPLSNEELYKNVTADYTVSISDLDYSGTEETIEVYLYSWVEFKNDSSTVVEVEFMDTSIELASGTRHVEMFQTIGKYPYIMRMNGIEYTGLFEVVHSDQVGVN